MPGGSAVHTHGKVVVGFAGFELARIVVSGHVPEAAHFVVGVLAVLPGVRAGASAHAEFCITDEAGPFCVLAVRPEGVAEDKASNRVAIAVRTVRIQFTALIAFLDIDLCEITDASDLDVVLGTDKVNAFESAIGDDTGASTALGAPSNFVTLSITNSADAGRCPQAEIVCVIHPHGLTHRALRRLGAASVGTSLTAFRLGRQLVVHVTSIPNLIVVILVRVARPDLYLVSICHFAVGQIHTFALGPFDMVVAELGVTKLLVGAFRHAIPNLKLGAIGVLAIGDVDTLGTTVKRDGTLGAKFPLLV